MKYMYISIPRCYLFVLSMDGILPYRVFHSYSYVDNTKVDIF